MGFYPKEVWIAFYVGMVIGFFLGLFLLGLFLVGLWHIIPRKKDPEPPPEQEKDWGPDA